MSNLLVEYTPFKPVITEATKKPGIFEVTGVMQRANAKNQNGRIYPKALLDRQVQQYIESFVKVGNAYGELDHPESPIVSLKNASHVVKDLWWDGDDLMGKVELLNTPSGNIVKEIILGGHTIGISSRGTGSVQPIGENTLMVKDDFELVCWDFVSNPSTHGAFLAPVSLNESAARQANNYARVNEIIRDIICTNTCTCSLE